VSLAIFEAGCGRKADDSPIAALDDAYKSGVVTKAEYDVKRASLLRTEQLAALDDAYKSGVLTKAEYDAKRAVLAGAWAASAANAPAVSPPSQASAAATPGPGTPTNPWNAPSVTSPVPAAPAPSPGMATANPWAAPAGGQPSAAPGPPVSAGPV